MYIYFSASFPAAIKFNGIYYGIINDTVKTCNFDKDFTPFIEVCPLDNNSKQLNFLLDEHFLLSPPEDVVVTDMRGGYLIKFIKKQTHSEFKIIAQNKFNDALVTVFSEMGLKISIETQSDFFAETISSFSNSAEIKRFSSNNCNFISIYFIDTETLCVYRIDDKICKVFCREVYDYSLDGGLLTKEKYSDMAKHKISSSWNFDGNKFVQNSKEIFFSPDFSSKNLNDKLKPFAFLEELLVGGNVSEYLSDDIKQNADRLLEYLGNYIGIMPPPLFRKVDEIGLVFPDGKNRYRVDYCTCTLNSGKICNVKKCDK